MKYLMALFVILTLSGCSKYVSPQGIENAVSACKLHGGLKYITGLSTGSFDSFSAFCQDNTRIIQSEHAD